LGAPLATSPIHIAVNRDRGDVLRMINDGLKELYDSGEYERIYRKWFITEITDREKDSLIKSAKQAVISAYAPYSRENTGAAVLTATGKIFTGCAVENAEGKLSLSALRSAVARSIMENELEIKAAAIVDQNGNIVLPSAEECQVLYEFGRGILVLVQEKSGQVNAPMVAELLKNPVSKNVFQVDMQ
jgi:cytidine deaminase